MNDKYQSKDYEAVSDGFKDGFGKDTKYSKVTYIPGLQEMVESMLKKDYNNDLATELPDGIYSDVEGEWYVEKFNIKPDEKWFIMGRFSSLDDAGWCGLKKALFEDKDIINHDDPTPCIEMRINITNKELIKG